MKRKILLFCVIFFSVFSLFAQNRPRLAILPFTGGTGDEGETIAELFSFEPEIDRNFTRIPRTSSIQTIMQEHQFQRSTGLTDSDTIARIGRQLNAEYVLAGHIQVLGSSRLVLITIIHVESLQQIAGDYKEYYRIDEMLDKIPAMAKRIAEASRRNRTNLAKLAILPFNVPSSVSQNDAEVLAQLFATEVANSGKYAALPRTSTIESVMREHKIQRSDLTESDNIKKIGIALNAKYVLVGNIRSLGQTNMFTAQILDVETASMVVGDRESYSNLGDGLSKISVLANKLTVRDPSARYIIGDKGPAGGIIFYDKGNNSGGWRYLEAAPASTEFSNIEWGAYRKYGLAKTYASIDIFGLDTSIGSGKRNTELIVNKLNQLGETGRAAQVCANLRYGGFKDWFLPSYDELELMLTNLKYKKLGDFYGDFYWSSTQVYEPLYKGENFNGAWGRNFGDKLYDHRQWKNTQNYVRAIRSFE